jgi:hypothetical protein
MKWVDIVGWVGTASVLLAYACLSYGAIANGWVYQSMNLLGAVGLGLTAVKTKNHQSLVVQIFWAIIGILWFLSNMTS